MKRLLTVSILGTALAASSAFGAIVTYNNQGSFVTGTVIGGAILGVENFNSGNSSLFTLTNNSAQSSFVNLGGGDFAWQSGVGVGVTQTITPVVGPLSGFGGTFNTSPGVLGSGLTITVNYASGGPSVFSNIGNGTFFWGVGVDGVSPLITSVVIQAGTNPGFTGEVFQLDNVQRVLPGNNEGPGPTVPEPSTFGLMGLAMVGIGLARKLRK